MNKSKVIYTISLILVIASMLIFELLYCNSRLMQKILFDAQNNAVYNFSLFRLLLYIVVIVVLILLRKKLINILEENKDIQIRKYILIISSILAALGVIYVTFKFVNKLLPLSKIAVEYLTIILSQICLVYLSRDYIKNIIIIASTISLLFVVTIDINNTIDEKKHFMSAYCISTGQFSLSDPKVEKNFFELEHLIKYTSIENFELIENNFDEELTEDYNRDDISSTPAAYNPLLYLPGGIGIFLAKNLSHSMMDIYFAGRIFNLMAYTILIIIALKILPYKKNTFLVVFLMPMLLAMAAVYSIDSIVMGIVSIFIAYCLKLKEKEKVVFKDICILFLMFVLLCAAKSMAYIFVALIALILPIKKILKNNKKQIPFIIIAILITLGVVLAIFLTRDKVSADPRGGNTNVRGQISYMINNPIEDIKLVFNHIKLTMGNYNWLTGLNHKIYFSSFSDYSTLFLLFYVIYVALTDNTKNFKIKEKILFILAFVLTYYATSFIMYLIFTPVGSKEILGYQTRYIFPILPLLLMCISNSNLLFKSKQNIEFKISCVSTLFIIMSIIGSVSMG